MPADTSPSRAGPDSAEPAGGAAGARRHLAGGVLSATGAQVATIAAATVMSVIIARVVGPSGNGLVALAASLTNIVAQVFTLGLGTGITYMVGSGRWAPGPALRATQRAGAAMGLTGAAAAAGVYAVAGDALFKGLGPSIAAAAVVAVPFVVSWGLAAAVALAQERYEVFAACSAFQAVSMLALVAALVGPFGAEGAVWALAASHAATTVLALLLTRRGAPAAPGAGARTALPAALRFGLQTWAAELLALVAYRLDLFILNGYTTAASVGLYSVSVTITALAWVLPGALQAVLVPRAAHLGRTGRDGDTEASDVLAARAVRHALLLLVPTAAVLALLLLAAVPLLYGQRFEGSVELGFILLPGALALALTKVLTGVIIGAGFPRYSLFTTLIVTPVTVVLYFLLIEAMQARGAAIATTISYTASLACSMVFFRRVTRLRARDLVPGREDLLAYRQATGALLAYLRTRGPLGS